MLGYIRAVFRTESLTVRMYFVIPNTKLTFLKYIFLFRAQPSDGSQSKPQMRTKTVTSLIGNFCFMMTHTLLRSCSIESEVGE